MLMLFHSEQEAQEYLVKLKVYLERLENIWLDSSCRTLQARMEKGAEVLGGWEQYFCGERTVQSILEYAIWVYQMKRRGKPDLSMMKKLRRNFCNPYKDVMMFLADVWKEAGLEAMEIDEYEQYYSLYGLDTRDILQSDAVLMRELAGTYRKYVIQESEEIRAELIQLYTDLKMYQKAGALLELSGRRESDVGEIEILSAESAGEEEFGLNAEEILKYMKLFVGREDIYAIDCLTEEGKRRNKEILQPLQPEVIKNHLAGKETVSTYIQRSNATVKYFVLDLDISKGVLLQVGEEEKQQYMKKCLEIAHGICKELRKMGLEGLLEQSGCRGYHVWVFFREWIPVRYVNLLADIIEKRAGALWKDSGIQAEFFPNKTRLRNGKRGQTLKLPWGIHPKTGNRSFFLNVDYRPYHNQKEVLNNVVSYSGNTVKRILASNQLEKETNTEIAEVDRDLQEFGEVGNAVKAVADSCSLLRYLCQKARKTHYLTHFERLTVLYVFGHLGEEGKEFIHKVMSFTLNYSYQTTQKFIHHCPEKPVSCIKLREQYRQLSAETGCSCNFKRTKNCYPSPVLHALKKADGSSQVTMPLSRTATKEQQKILREEINAGLAVQPIAEKMIELRKQKRNLDKALERCEKELSRIFDDNNTNSMEIKEGLLIRRRSSGKIEWVIEL